MLALCSHLDLHLSCSEHSTGLQFLQIEASQDKRKARAFNETEVERTLLLESEGERRQKRRHLLLIKRIHLEQVLAMIYLQQSTSVAASVIV